MAVSDDRQNRKDDRQHRKPPATSTERQKRPEPVNELSLDDSETAGIDPYNTATIPNLERHWRD